MKSSYRASQIYGFDLPRLIKSLLFVAIGNAPGAKRFANGDWTDLSLVMPPRRGQTRAECGLGPFIMDTFLQPGLKQNAFFEPTSKC